MAFLRFLAFAVLIALAAWQYRDNERLRGELARARPGVPAEPDPATRLKAALDKAIKDPHSVVDRLQALVQPGTKAGAPAAGSTASSPSEAGGATAGTPAAAPAKTAAAKAPAAKKGADLETLLKLPPYDGSKDKPAAAAAASCKALEDNPIAFSGRRVTVNDVVENLGGFFSFAKCSGVTISAEHLDAKSLSALKKRCAPSGGARVTLAGEFHGLELSVDQIK